MKIASLPGILLGLATASFAQDDIAKAQVEKASQDYVRAVEMGDLQRLEKLQAPTMVYTAANNRRMTREEVYHALQGDFGKWSLHNTVIQVCQVFGDTAVTSGTEEVRTKSGPLKGTSTLRRFTNVWQRSGSNWIMIARDVAVIRTQPENGSKTRD